MKGRFRVQERNLNSQGPNNSQEIFSSNDQNNGFSNQIQGEILFLNYYKIQEWMDMRELSNTTITDKVKSNPSTTERNLITVHWFMSLRIRRGRVTSLIPQSINMCHRRVTINRVRKSKKQNQLTTLKYSKCSLRDKISTSYIVENALKTRRKVNPRKIRNNKNQTGLYFTRRWMKMRITWLTERIIKIRYQTRTVLLITLATHPNYNLISTHHWNIKSLPKFNTHWILVFFTIKMINAMKQMCQVQQ